MGEETGICERIVSTHRERNKSQQQIAMCLHRLHPLFSDSSPFSSPSRTSPVYQPHHLLSYCLRLAANIAQFVVIIQDIEPHNVRRHHQFQNADV